MSEISQSLRGRLEAWAGMENAAQRKEEWYRIAEDPSCGEAVFALIHVLQENVVKKQVLAEERQGLINKWQKEKEAALQDVETVRKTLETSRRETEKAEERMRGYEKQFVSLQGNVRQMEEKADYMTAQCEQARKETQESKDQAAELRERLVSLQENARQMEEKADYMAAQCEQARKEMQENMDLVVELRERLTEAKQYGAEMAMKAGELENLFSVKLYRKLHRKKEGN